MTFIWRRVNLEPVEYEIQQGPHGDEFVRKPDGTCLKRLIKLEVDDAIEATSA